MSIGRQRIGQRLLAFVPVLMLVASLPGELLMRCRMDGMAWSACCCPATAVAAAATYAAADAERAIGRPRFRRQACCEQRATTVLLPIAKPDEGAKRFEVAAAAGAWAAVLFPGFNPSSVPIRLATAREVREHDPPRAGPPIIVLKHAYLI